MSKKSLKISAASDELVSLGCRVGVAEMSVGGAVSLEDLVVRADALMFKDKARKKLPTRAAA